MDPFFFFVGASVVFAIVVVAIKKRRVRRLPEFTDEAFAAWVSERLGISSAEAVRDRQRLAELLGIPATRIPPETNLDDLLGAMTRFERRISLGHFEDEALEQFEDARFPGEFVLPRNAAEWVAFRARVRSTKSPK